MLKIHTLTLGDYQTNTYIVHDSGSRSCVIIDPGYQPETILKKVTELGLQVEAVLLTHGHFDHVGGVKQIVKTTGCALWIHQGDDSQKKSPMTAFLYPIANCNFTEVNYCEDAEEIRAAGLTFTVYATPGHTWGSVCYRCGDALFSGDTLFAGGCGRTDLPGGSYAVILESLHRLSEIPDNLQVYPGHGESTTLAQEKRYNPYLR